MKVDGGYVSVICGRLRVDGGSVEVDGGSVEVDGGSVSINSRQPRRGMTLTLRNYMACRF